MGYEASSSGSVVLKNKDDAEKVVDFIKNSECFDEVDYDFNTTIDLITYGDMNYHEDDVYNLYSEIAPYIKEAEIIWEGEDDSHWKHTYDEDKGWLEMPGNVTYDEGKAWSIACNKEEEKDL